MNKYIVWKVFEDSFSYRFYIVNRLTKEVQSVWVDYKDAVFTQTKLNVKISKRS